MNDDWTDYAADHNPAEELEHRAADAITHAVQLGISEDEARLLCYLTGVSFKYVAHTHKQEPR